MCGLGNSGLHRCNSRWNMVYTKWNRLSHYQCESCRYRRNSGFSNGYIYSNKRQWLLNAATGTNASESHARKRSLRKRGTDVSVYRRARLSDESDMLHATSHTALRCARRGVFVAYEHVANLRCRTHARHARKHAAHELLVIVLLG